MRAEEGEPGDEATSCNYSEEALYCFPVNGRRSLASSARFLRHAAQRIVRMRSNDLTLFIRYTLTTIT